MAAVTRKVMEAAVVDALAELGEHVLDRPHAAKAIVDAIQRTLAAQSPPPPAGTQEPTYAAERCTCPSHGRSAMWAVSDGERHALMTSEAAARTHARSWSTGERTPSRLLIWHGIGS